MVEVQSCEVDALPAPFSLAQQWVGIVKNCMITSHTICSWCNHGNQSMYLTVGQKHKGSDVTMETRACNLLHHHHLPFQY
jgi:hypothetical protein